MNSNSNLDVRLWSKVDVRGPYECWPWNALRRDGQPPDRCGFVDSNGRAVRGHVAAWETVNGPVGPVDKPHDACVCHTCDYPLCCNPAHLFLGTQAENMRDALAKGRHGSQINPNWQPSGDAHWTRKAWVGMTTEQRFWSQVDKTDASGCWLWTGSTNGSGAVFRPDPKEGQHLARRLAWKFSGRELKGKLYSSCGVLLCVNPDHLSLSPRGKAPLKRRSYVGTGNPAAKFTAADVLAIRSLAASGATLRVIATSFDTNVGRIEAIVSRRSYSDVA